ncbi:MAG: MFS transporter [Gemmatimonadaceae bacterium]
MPAAEPEALDTSLGSRTLELETMRRVSLRLMPFLFILYIFNFLDRTNVGLAALQMNSDLGFSSAAFGLGAGVFFIGYCLFEVPSNLLLLKVGARRWIARIMISWGIIAAGMMFVRTPMQFYVLRFLLGVAEAGFFPAVLFYLSRWYPAAMRARSLAWFMIAIPLSGAVGGPLGAWLLDFDGRLGIDGWQWLFLVEGVPSTLLGLVVLVYLTEQPEDARWLRDDQRQWLVEQLERDRANATAPHGLPPLRALVHPLIWLAALPELLVTTAGYAYVFWGPTLVRETLGLSNSTMGWLLAGIAILCALALVLMGASSDRSGERVLHAAACAFVVAMACFAAGLLADPVAKIVSLVVMQVAVIAFLAPFWTIPTILLSGSSAAVGIALVNAIGNVGGFIGPSLIGFLRKATGQDAGAFYVLAVMALVASVVCLGMRWNPAFARRKPVALAVPIPSPH